MEGTVLFVDAAKPGADAAALARALSIDPYRARLLANAGAPFLAHGFHAVEAARAAAAAVEAAGFPASVHEAGSVDAIPVADEALAFRQEDGPERYTFSTEGNGTRVIEAARVRVLVSGALTVRIGTESSAARALGAAARRGIGGIVDAVMDVSAAESERVLRAPRLEIFAEGADGALLRVGIRFDRFDFSALGARKTLSAARNIEALRDALARGATGVVVDDLFPRTEMARANPQPDAWNEADPLGGSARPASARTNRQAFDLYARLRWLHVQARRRPGAAPPATPADGHFYEF